MLRKIILVALAAVVTHSFGAAQAPQAAAKTVVAAVKNDGKPLYVAGPVSDELKQKCTKTVTWNADDAAWLRKEFMASPSFTLVEESTRPAVKQIKGFLDATAVTHFSCVFLDTKEHFYVSVTPQKTVDGQKAYPAVVVHGASKTEPVDFMVFLETVATKQAGGSWLSSIRKGIGAVGTAIAGKVFVLDLFLNKRRADAEAKAAAEKARLAQEKRRTEVCAEIKTLEAELGEGPFDTKDKDVKTLEAERDRLKLLKETRDKAEQERLAEEKRKAEQLAVFNAAKTAARSKSLTICGAREKAIEIQGIHGGWGYLAGNNILELDGTTDANRLCTHLIRTISPIKLQTDAGAKSDLAKALEGDKTAFAAARKALQSNLDYLDQKSATENTLYSSWSGHPDNIRGVLRQDLETYIQFHRDLLAELDRLTQEAEGEAQGVAALLEQIRVLEVERGGDKFDATGKTAAECEAELARLRQTRARPAPRVDASAAGTVADAYAPIDDLTFCFEGKAPGQEDTAEYRTDWTKNLSSLTLCDGLDARLRGAVSAFDMKGKRYIGEGKFGDILSATAEDAVDAYQDGDWLGFAVYDGHCGYQVACALAGVKKGAENVLEFDPAAQSTRLLPALIDVVKAHGVDQEKINALYLDIDKKLIPVAEGSGSTAVVMLINLVTQQVHFINLGDSRAVAVDAEGEPVRATVDHDPKCEAGCSADGHADGCEVKRIEGAGGQCLGGRIQGSPFNLGVARSFGDFGFKPPQQDGTRKYHVGIVPDVQTFNLNDAKQIVLACDGVWDVIGNVAGTRHVRIFFSEIEVPVEAVGAILQRAAEGNFNPAEYLCKSAMVAGSIDNVSAIVIDVQRILAALTPVPRVDASGSTGSVTGDVDPLAATSGLGGLGVQPFKIDVELFGKSHQAHIASQCKLCWEDITRNLTPPAVQELCKVVREHPVSIFDMNGMRIDKWKQALADVFVPEPEDAVDVYKDGNWTGFAVYDGHLGKKISLSLAGLREETDGSLVSYDYARLLPLIITLVKQGGDYTEAVKGLFKQLDLKFENEYFGESGAATVVCLVDDALGKGYLINLGDSRGVVVAKNPTNDVATCDHVLKCKVACVHTETCCKDVGCGLATGCTHADGCEVGRVGLAGGTVWLTQQRINSPLGLKIARAFGDFSEKKNVSGERQYCVGIEPDFYHFNLSDAAYIVLACDGVWDVIKSEEIRGLIGKAICGGYDPAEFIAKEALKRGSNDNISVILIPIAPFDRPSLAPSHSASGAGDLDDVDDEDVPGSTLGGSRRGGASTRVPDELLEVTGLAAQRLATIVSALSGLKEGFENTYSNKDLFTRLHVVPSGRLQHYPVTDIGRGVAFDATRDFRDPLLSFHKICDGLFLGNNDVINYLLGLNASSGPKLAQINDLGKGDGDTVMGWCDFAASNPQKMGRLPTLVITFDDKNEYPRLKEGEIVPIAGVECLYLPLPETTEGAFIKLLQNKRLLFGKIIEHLNKQKGNVLLHCHAGNHRSVGALLYFLFEAFKREVPLFDLSEYIYSKRAAAKRFYDLAQGGYNDISPVTRERVYTMPTTNLLYQVMVHCCGQEEVA